MCLMSLFFIKRVDIDFEIVHSEFIETEITKAAPWSGMRRRGAAASLLFYIMECAVSELENVKRKIRALSEKTVENGATEQEALAAMEKVGALMEQYNLSMSEVYLRSLAYTTWRYNTGHQKRNDLYLIGHGLATAFQGKYWVHLTYDTDEVRAYNEAQASYLAARRAGRVVPIPTLEQPKKKFHIFLFLNNDDLPAAQYLMQICAAAFVTETNRYKQSSDYRNSTIHRRVKTNSFQSAFCSRLAERIIEMNKKAEAVMIPVAPDSPTRKSLVAVKNELVEQEFAQHGPKKLVTGYAGARKYSHSAAEAGKAAANNVNLGNKVDGYLST